MRIATTEGVYSKLELLLSMQNTTEQDKSFIRSLSHYAKSERGLSTLQVEWVERLYEKYHLPKEWVDTYTDEKRQNFDFCMFYYGSLPGVPYFKSVVKAHKEDPKYVPTEKVYNLVCKNKYAQKVISESRKEPAFQEGQMVELRATFHRNQHRGVNIQYGTSFILIVEALEMVTSPCRGAKRYLCLPVGQASTTVIEERHLKKLRGKKK